MPLGPSSLSNALSSPPNGPLSRELFGHLSAKTFLIFSTVGLSLPLSLFPVRGALLIGRVSQPWPTVWNIFFAGLIGCRWRSQKAGTRQPSELSPLPLMHPLTDASGTQV